MKEKDIVVFKSGPDSCLHEITRIEGKAVTIKNAKTSQVQIVGISRLSHAGEAEKEHGFREINPSNYRAEHAHYWNAPTGYWQSHYAEIS